MTEEQANREPAQPQEGGGEPHANPEPAVRASLGEWRGPAFWMSCGALLAGMAGGAVVLAQRVSVERDMMAVAATMPPANAAPAAPPLAEARLPSAPIEQPVTATPPRHSVRMAPAAAVPHATVLGKPARKAAAAKRKVKVRRHVKAADMRERYPEVFKRCPELGAAGSVECRRHICNGAEGAGPACKPYKSNRR